MLAGTGQGGQCQSLQEGPPGKMDTHSLIHLSWAQAQLFFRASAQRGHGIPAAPARGCTSRSPDWPLPHNHS